MVAQGNGDLPWWQLTFTVIQRVGPSLLLWLVFLSVYYPIQTVSVSKESERRGTVYVCKPFFLCGIMATGDILSFVGSLCRMSPNLTTRAYLFFILYCFFMEFVGGF